MSSLRAAQSYFLQTDSSEEAATIGLHWLTEYALEHKYFDAGLYVSTMQKLDALASSLGGDATRTLRWRRTTWMKGVRVKLMTARTTPTWFEGPILALWVDDRVCEALEALGAAALGAVARTPAELTNWRVARNPLHMRTGIACAGSEFGNAVVRAAISELGGHIQPSTGVAPAAARAAAIGLFHTLRQAKEQFGRDDVRALALLCGWSGAHATELGELAQKIAEGCRVTGRRRDDEKFTLADVERWRAIAAK